MAKVRCPFSGDQIDIERSADYDEGDTWICPDCKGDVVFGPERRLRHASGKWLTCPANQAGVFVWTEEDETVMGP
jgi:hypothetical protein